MAERPVFEKFPGDFMPENTNSSGLTSLGILHVSRLNLDVLVEPNSVLGMQKSWTGSGSEAEVVRIWRDKIDKKKASFGYIFLPFFGIWIRLSGRIYSNSGNYYLIKLNSRIYHFS